MDISTKYRPKTIDSYIGNAKLKREITKIMGMEEDNLPKSFMFVGPSGCGKTTIARLLAKRYLLNKENESYFDDYIETGNTNYIEDLMEIDVGQDRGIANMEAIKADIVNPPLIGDGWKVYIFDEFHNSSKASQNALLKLLEDTPPKVLMIFCTTNQRMVLPTILGRIQHIYQVSKPDSTELTTYLANVCKKENWKYDLHGLQTIAKISGYQIRDALRNLADVIQAYDDATLPSVSDKFDVITDIYAQKFFKAYKNKDFITGMDAIYTVKTRYNLQSFYELLKEYIKRGIYISNGILVQGYDKKELQSYKQLFKDFTITELSGMLKDLMKLEQCAGDESDLEVHLLSMVIEGIPQPQLVQVAETKEEEKEEKENKKSFVNMKAIEDSKRKQNITKKVQEKQKSAEEVLKTLSTEVSILENLDLFGGKVYIIEATF